MSYIFIKYQAVNDNLLEAFKYNTKKIDNNITLKAKRQFSEEKADTERKVGQLLLLYVDDKISDNVTFEKIRQRAYKIMKKHDIEREGNKYYSKAHHEKQAFWNEVDKMQKTYQKNLRPLFYQIEFASEKENVKWIKSIEWLKQSFSKNKIEDCPSSMPKYLKKYLFNKDNSIKLLGMNTGFMDR